MAKSETEIQGTDVEHEHLKGVRIGAHWGYLFGVLLGSTALMVALIALLGASS